MSDADIPDKIGPAARWAVAGIALFVFFLVAVEKFNEGQLQGGFINAGLFCVTFLIAVKWNAIASLFGAAATYLFLGLTASGVLAVGIAIGILVARQPRFSDPAAIGNIVWNFEQTAHGAGYFLTMQKLSDQPEIRVISFGARGKNTSDKPITKFSGTMRSEQITRRMQIDGTAGCF
jgi:hypothetical protein